MSDQAPPVEPAPAPPVAPPSPATDAAPPAPPPPAAPQAPAYAPDDPLADDLLDYGQQQFPRVVVEKLRAEAANRRVALREAEQRLAPYQEAFANLTDDDQATLLAFTKTLATDPMTAAEWMLEQGQTIKQQAEAALHPEPQTPPQGQPAYEPNDPNRPWTVADQRSWEAQQAQRVQQEQLISHWNREATRLGYDVSARPDSPEGPMRWLQFQQLVKMAEVTGGNLEQAHNLLVAQAQGAANVQIQQRAAQVRATVGQNPPPADAEPDEPVSQSQRWQRINEVVNQRIGGEPVV